MSKPAEFDVDASATRISSLFQQSKPADAVALLEHERKGQPEALQDALDRYVIARAGEQIRPLVWCPHEELREHSGPLQRLYHASDAPRMPSEEDMRALPSEAQKYDVYASVVAVRGNDDARSSLATLNERVILGLRRENSTLAAMENARTPAQEAERHSGTGLYNDHLIVLWRDENGNRHVHATYRANTEPTAQYDHHAGADGKRKFADGGRVAARLDASEGYGQVGSPRKIEGEDNNHDGVRDLGRLAEGTIEMVKAHHPNPAGALANGQFNALRPSADAVSEANRHNRVERDTNGDGWFDDRDPNRWSDLNLSYKQHAGSKANTDSAGCQTTHPDDYKPYLDAVGGNPKQTRWQYVLTSTSPAVEHVQQVDTLQTQHRDPGRAAHAAPAGHGRPAGAPHAPSTPAPHHNPQPERSHFAPGDEPAGAPTAPRGPDHPDHPDHAMLEQIRGGVRGLDAAHGRAYDAGSEQMSRCLLAQCRDANPALALDRVDHVMLSHDGKGVFAVQGAVDDAANRWAYVPVAQARQTPVEQSDARLAAATQSHEQAREHVQAQQASMAQAQRGPVLQQQITA